LIKIGESFEAFGKSTTFELSEISLQFKQTGINYF